MGVDFIAVHICSSLRGHDIRFALGQFPLFAGIPPNLLRALGVLRITHVNDVRLSSTTLSKLIHPSGSEQPMIRNRR